MRGRAPGSPAFMRPISISPPHAPPGSRRAIAAFEAAYSTDLAAVIRRVSGSVDVEEVMQNLRESLFVGKGGAPSKVRDYSGSGPLRAWLRVMSTRAALNAVTRGPKERLARGDDELIADAAGGVESAEVAYFRVHYEAEVKTAFPQALAALSQRERLLLCQHYVDRLALDEMAGVHAVHVATIKRQLASAREALTGHLRALLLQRLRLSPSELQSVLVLVQSRLHVTMRRLLPDRSSASAVLEPLPDSGSLSEE